MIISRTPLRISFFGGGTDFSEFYSRQTGAVLSTTIDKYVYVFVNKKIEDWVRIAYSKTELVSNVSKIKHDIIRSALILTNITKGVDISYMGDIMVGKSGIGLASSSALTAGALHALYEFKKKQIKQEQLASDACKVEIDYLKRPIGKQDQYAVSFGGLNLIEFFKNEKVKITPIRIKESVKQKLCKNLILLDTSILRKSEEILSEQRINTRDSKNTRSNLSQMVSFTYEACRLLESGKLDEFGTLLGKSWKLKKSLARAISNSRIDKWYKIALEKGALGGKICGAGGGGFLLLYAPFSKHTSILTALPKLARLPFSFENTGSQIIYEE